MKEFPVLMGYRRRPSSPVPRAIPWSFIEPARAQALANHDQTLERLAERGGLDPGEIRCAIEGNKLWPHFDDLGKAGNEARNEADRVWLLDALAKHPEKLP